MESQLRIIGFLLIVLAIVHFFFPRYFKWKEELASLALINRQMMYVHTFFIAIVLLLMGVLCLTSSEELVGTRLGSKIALGFAIFWFMRLLIQFFGYSSLLWKGKKLETVIHVFFSFLWIYLCLIFAMVYLDYKNY